MAVVAEGGGGAEIGDGFEFGDDGFAVVVDDGDGVRRDADDVAVAQLREFLGVAAHRQQIGSQKVPVGAAADQQGAAETAADDLIGALSIDDGDGVGAAQFGDGGAQGGDQIGAGVFLQIDPEQLHDDLGVGVGRRT